MTDGAHFDGSFLGAPVPRPKVGTESCNVSESRSRSEVSRIPELCASYDSVKLFITFIDFCIVESEKNELEVENAQREADEDRLLKRIENVDIQDCGGGEETNSDSGAASEEEEDDEEDDDDEGWITTDNIQNVSRLCCT